MIPKVSNYLSCWRTLSLKTDALAALQAQRLQATIRHAYQNVAYYRHMFDAAGITPEDIRTPEDLGHVPTSSKDDLLDAGCDNLIAANLERSGLISSLTSGSTGKAFTVLRTQADMQRRKFLELRALIKVGFQPWDKMALYTVRRSHGGSKSQKLFYRVKWFSALQSIGTAVAELSSYDPSFLWAYPSSFRMLLDFTNTRLDFACTPRVLVTTAEAPDKTLRDACKLFSLEHFNFYGSVETGRIAWECRAHDGLHLNTDNVVLEIVPTAGSKSSDTANVGETVITTLNNEAMPFIRYRLGDLCGYLDRTCSCGIALPLISAPIGRSSDLVKLPSGRVLTARGLAAVIRQHRGVRQHQITQRDLRHVEIKLVVDHPFTDYVADELSTQLQEHLGEPVEVAIRIVDSIEQPGPKAKDFISLIQ